MAAVPPTQTCMTCHAGVLPDSPAPESVRTSFSAQEPIAWTRVHMLPDYGYFDHSAHLAAGVGCSECHGRIDQMEVVRQAQPLSMGWCLECHRDPTPRLRPVSEITNMQWDQAKAGYDPHQDPARERPLQPPVDCSGCHR